MIRPEELEDVDTEESSVPDHRDYAESIRASGDSIKVSKKYLTLHNMNNVYFFNMLEMVLDKSIQGMRQRKKS